MLNQESLQRRYGLTGTEVRLASALCEYYDLGKSAVQIGISKEHARSRLKSIFAKTGTHKQVELIMLMTNSKGH